MGEKLKLLVTVKTYPLPSESYQELVCTAGVRDDGSFVRLYPVDYRYRPYCQWYKKYQWIEVEVEKNMKDPRPESFRPVPGTRIKTLGERLSTKDNWADRKKYVLASGVETMCGLQEKPPEECSLGIIRPREVLDFVVEPTERDWKPEWKGLFLQQKLFGPDQKPLEKIPYRFSYRFRCEASGCIGHKMMIADWEVGQLYRKMRDDYGSEQTAIYMVKQRFLEKICAPEIDTHFFVGTVLQYHTWIVLGVFWPKKTKASE